MATPQRPEQPRLFGIIPVEPISRRNKKIALTGECLIGIAACLVGGDPFLAEMAAVGAIVTASMPECRPPPPHT